ncbi:MAG: peroxiredoxin [Hyphomicrobiaceae bacterium]|nr:peroxiredoxin [Hyphomicrobiaceae bacterium]
MNVTGSSMWPWPSPLDDGAASHLTVGTLLPQVALPSSAGVDIDLSMLKGRIVVFVYPFTGAPGVPNPPGWDDIPGAHGSTPEAEGFRDLMPMFAVRSAKVFGLSSQAVAEQEAFARRAAITYPLLSDMALRLSDALRLPRFETGGSIYLKRLTLLAIDGRITRCIYPVYPPHTHAAEVLAALG